MVSDGIKYYLEGLLFRNLELKDVSQRYVDWLNDHEVNQFLESRHQNQTIEGVKNFVSSCNKSNTDILFGVFLFDSEHNTEFHIGNVKIGLINQIHKTGEVGILIGEKKIWGQGFGVRIIRAISIIAKNHLGLRKLTAGCYGKNFGSYKAFVKAGFTFVGERKNQYVSGRGFDSLLLFDAEI